MSVFGQLPVTRIVKTVTFDAMYSCRNANNVTEAAFSRLIWRLRRDLLIVKGKAIEKWRRKASGLNAQIERMAAGLPVNRCSPSFLGNASCRYSFAAADGYVLCELCYILVAINRGKTGALYVSPISTIRR